MRTIPEIRAELTSFEAEFEPVMIPAGTPDRRALEKAARREAQERACAPAQVARRIALHAELRRAQALAKRRATISQPIYETRRWLERWLRRLGFERERSTRSKSVYYIHIETGMQVRISDHDVPMTDARAQTIAAGGWSWAEGRWDFRVTEPRMALARSLVELRRRIKEVQR